MNMQDISEWSLVQIVMTVLLLSYVGMKKIYIKIKSLCTKCIEKFSKKKETKIEHNTNTNK